MKENGADFANRLVEKYRREGLDEQEAIELYAELEGIPLNDSVEPEVADRYLKERFGEQ